VPRLDSPSWQPTDITYLGDEHSPAEHKFPAGRKARMRELRGSTGDLPRKASYYSAIDVQVDAITRYFSCTIVSGHTRLVLTFGRLYEDIN